MLSIRGIKVRIKRKTHFAALIKVVFVWVLCQDKSLSMSLSIRINVNQVVLLASMGVANHGYERKSAFWARRLRQI